MSIQKANLKRLQSMTAAPLVATKVPAGAVVPDASDEPVEGVDAYEHIIIDPKDHQTIADRVNYLCDALGGAKFSRRPTDKGVDVFVKLADGITVIGGHGATTAAAFNDLLENTRVLTGATPAKKGGK